MDAFKAVGDWFSSHSTVVWWLTALSLVFLLVMPFAGAWAIATLPKDYFTCKRRPLERLEPYPVLRMLAIGAKTLLGLLLVIAGLIMLVAPGQGVLTIIAGLALIEFPGKNRLERWLVTRPRVWRSLNWLRKKFHRPELEKPTSSAKTKD
jgi:hypothetical protein